jgi:hypothetical protein
VAARMAMIGFKVLEDLTIVVRFYPYFLLQGSFFSLLAIFCPKKITGWKSHYKFEELP